VSVAARYWPLLFPATYLIHIAEEYWAGEGFYNWISRVAGGNLTAERFLALNAVAWVVMLTLCLLAAIYPEMRVIVIAFATVTLLNGLAHISGTAITLSYSPGLISGLFVWIPLGAATLYHNHTCTRRAHFNLGVIVGLALHAIVAIVALLG